MRTRWIGYVLSLALLAMCRPAQAGLIGYWAFDENTGYTAVDSGSGGNDGTLTPSDPTGPTWTPGVSGSGLHFDDAGDYIGTGYAGVGGSDPRSVAFWVRTTDTGTTGLVAWGDDQQDGQKWHVRVNSAAADGLVGGIRTEVQGGYIVGDVNIADGAWHHVASVFDGANVSDVVHYVDGAPTGTSGVNPEPINTDVASVDALPVTIARRTQGSNNETLAGTMDEVRIYDHALTAGEVADLAATAPPSPGVGLVAHWDFEDNTGYTVADVAGGNNGTATPSDETGPRWLPGYTGQALRFDGTGDAVEAVGFKGVPGKEARTMSAWVKLPTGAPGDNEILSWGNNVAGQKWIFRTQDDNGPFDGNLRVEVNGGYVVGTMDLRDGQWHHVAAVLPDSPNPNVTDVLLYVDGAPDPISANQGEPINTAVGEDVRIGVGHSGLQFNGSIDEVRIYNTALSAGEIAGLASVAATPPPTGLVAHWNFNDGAGNTAADVAGRNTATLLPDAGPPEWSTDAAPLTGGIPGSLDFSTANGYLEATEYKGIGGTAERTVSAWIKTNSNGDQAIVSWGNNSAGDKWTFRIQDDTGPLDGVLRVEVNGGYVVGSTLLDDNEWHHVAAVLPPLATPNVNNVKLYVDGVQEVLSANQGQAITTASNADVRIGNDFNGGRRFAGLMDDVRIYDYALSMLQLRELSWISTLQDRYRDAVLDDDPIAYWRLDELSGTTAINLGSLEAAAAGTYVGGTSQGQEGLLVMEPNPATYFNGTDTRINVPDNAAINNSGPLPSKSVELWFLADDPTGRQVLYEQGGITRGMNVYVEDGMLYVGAWNNSNDDGGTTSPWGPFFVSAPIEANAVYMADLILEADPSGFGGVLRGYLNGVEFGSLTGVGQLFSHGDDGAIGAMRQNAVFDGGNGNGDGYWFAGVIDEVSLYNMALTPDQIAWHYYAGSIPEPSSVALLGLGLAALARRRKRKAGQAGTTLVLLALFGILAPTTQAGLVAYWDFEDNTGYTASDSAAGHDGTLTPSDDGGPRWFAGYTGQALTFDGTGDRIEVTGYPGVTGTQPRTTAAWIKVDPGAKVNAAILSWGTNSAGQKWSFRIQDSNGQAGAIRTEVNGGYIVGTTDIRDGLWHHVAAVLPDGATDVQDMILYVDGMNDGVSASLSEPINTANGVNVRIGRDHNTRDFEGWMDEVRIYDHALGASEVAALAALAPTPPVTGLVAHWNFNDGPPSTTAADVAGRHTATLIPSADPPVWTSDTPTLPQANPYALDFSTADGFLNATEYKGIAGAAERTVSAWIKADTNTSQSIISWGNDSAGDKWTFRLQTENGPYDGVLRVEVNGGYVVGTTPLGDGQWHHVTAVLPDAPLSANVTSVRLYVDGMIEGVSAYQGQAITTASNANVRIGNDFNGGRRFNGLMDDVRVYDYGMTGSQVRELATGAAVPLRDHEPVVIDSAPMAYWRLNEANGSDAVNLGTLGPQAQGTYVGGVTQGVPGLLVMDDDRAAEFDGFSGQVDIPDVGAINSGGPYVDKSVELWFQTSDDVTSRQVLYEQGGQTRGLSLFIEDGQVFVGAWNTGNDDGNVSTPWPAPLFYATDILPNTKYMLDLVMAGDADDVLGTLNGYLNGELFDASQPDGITGVGRLFGHASDIAIGAYKNETRFPSGGIGGTTSGSWFAGIIDEVALYDRILTPDEIAFRYYNGSIPEPGSLALLGLGLAALARRKKARTAAR